MYARGAAIIVVGYDVTSKHTLDECECRIEDVRPYIDDHCLIVAVGNKIDLSREVDREEAISFFEKCGIPSSHYFETSAATGEGVEEFLEGTLRLWYEAGQSCLTEFSSNGSCCKDSSRKRGLMEGSKPVALLNVQGTLSPKIVFVGESATGAKTSLIFRILNNTFPKDVPSTIGASFSLHRVNVDGKQFKLEIWGLSSVFFLQKIISLFILCVCLFDDVQQILLVKNVFGV